MRNKLVDNRYRVIARIGQGAMGKVFEAEHVYTKRPGALKIIHPQFQQDEKYRVRFLREIELACRLHHPNTVQILDAGEAASNMLYMAMEFLNGQTLSNLLKQFPIVFLYLSSYFSCLPIRESFSFVVNAYSYGLAGCIS